MLQATAASKGAPFNDDDRLWDQHLSEAAAAFKGSASNAFDGVGDHHFLQPCTALKSHDSYFYHLAMHQDFDNILIFVECGICNPFNAMWDLHMYTTCDVSVFIQRLVAHYLTAEARGFKIFKLRPKKSQFLPIFQASFPHRHRILQLLLTLKQGRQAFFLLVTLNQDLIDGCVIYDSYGLLMCPI